MLSVAHSEDALRVAGFDAAAHKRIRTVINDITPHIASLANSASVSWRLCPQARLDKPSVQTCAPSTQVQWQDTQPTKTGTRTRQTRYHQVNGKRRAVVSTFDDEYLELLKEREARLCRPSTSQAASGKSLLDGHRRRVLIDWMVEVAEEYKLCPEALHLAVAILDQCLSRLSITVQCLQLLGITCIWVAAKYEEIYPPTVADLVEMTDHSYCASEMVEMERQVLGVLRFELQLPTIPNFLAHYALASGADCKVRALADYIAELSLLFDTAVRFLPSELAAASLALANLLLQQPVPAARLASATHQHPSQLRSVIHEMSLHFLWACRSGNSIAVKEKYLSGAFYCVAATPVPAHLNEE